MSARKAISSQMRRRGASQPAAPTPQKSRSEDLNSSNADAVEEELDAPINPLPEVSYQDILRLPKPKNVPDMVLQHNKRISFLQKTMLESLAVVNGNIDVLMQGHNTISESVNAISAASKETNDDESEVDRLRAEVNHLKDQMAAMKLNEQDKCLSPVIDESDHKSDENSSD